MKRVRTVESLRGFTMTVWRPETLAECYSPWAMFWAQVGDAIMRLDSEKRTADVRKEQRQ